MHTLVLMYNLPSSILKNSSKIFPFVFGNTKILNKQPINEQLANIAINPSMPNAALIMDKYLILQECTRNLRMGVDRGTQSCSKQRVLKSQLILPLVKEFSFKYPASRTCLLKKITFNSLVSYLSLIPYLPTLLCSVR